MEQVIQNKLLLIDFRAAELCQSRRHCRGWSLGKSENKVGKSHDDPERERQEFDAVLSRIFFLCVCVHDYESTAHPTCFSSLPSGRCLTHPDL